MRQPIDILIRTIKAGSPISGVLLQENRSAIIEHLCKNYDPEMAERLEQENNRHQISTP